MKIKKCYIYTRVSTSMQVDGFSLEAQRDKLLRYAEFQNMVVVGEYSDAGKSGKNTAGRPDFLRMLSDIENGKDNVDFVLVFKLSRFGRNAADVLSSLQSMQDFGVNLICVEDGIDSSKDSGKLMISVLSAVAEIERENILVQTMEGRKQKAREGKWNGGFAPYGYKLVNGELLIAEDEAEVIRIIFDKYVHTNMGSTAIAEYLNQQGYEKKVRQNGTLDRFSSNFIRKVIDNPIYCGRMAYGRRKTEKISGTRNEYHIVQQEEFPVYEGAHEGIVSVEEWEAAQRKRKATGGKWEKIYHPNREHLLSGLLRCPICGAGMYGNVNRKKKKDGTFYQDYYYYACKHRLEVDGHRCDYHRQWKQEKINAAVEEVILKLVNNPRFEAAIKEKIGSKIDTGEMEKELENLQKKLRQLQGAKTNLGKQIDSLDISDKHYDRKYEDMQTRLDKLYNEIDAVENSMEEVRTRIENIRQQKISGDQVYQFLLYFDKLYDRFTDAEKKEFLNCFIERVDIFPQTLSSGRILRHIKFRFPIFFDGQEVLEIGWDNETTLESIVCLTKQNFRMATQDDAAQVLSLYESAKSGAFCVWNESYPSMTEIAHDLETKNLYVMTDGNKIIGAISVVPENELDDFDCWSCKEGKEIARVVIEKTYQGRGLSFEMVQNIVPILRKNGCKAIHLSVVKTNIPAYKTYIKAGFAVVGEAQMYGNDYYLMEKAIDTKF